MNLRSILSVGPTLWGIGIFLVILGGSAPWIPGFLLTLVTGLLIWATLAYSLNLITGLVGYVSFGHVVFMAFGGYALAFGVGALNLHPVVGVALGAAVGLALALGIGLVTLRFRGVYFAIATLVIAVAALYIVLDIEELGDGKGIILNPAVEPLSVFYTILVTLAIEVGVTYAITHGRIGYGIRSIKGDEDAANTLGINAARIKLFVYALSGLFAGAAGGVYAWNVSGAFPYSSFSLTFSLQMLAMIVIGGMGTLLGPLIGTVAVYLPSQVFLTIPLLSGLQFIVIGLVVIIIALFVPGGIVGTLRKYIPEFRGMLE